jgi:hypothetical protein
MACNHPISVPLSKWAGSLTATLLRPLETDHLPKVRVFCGVSSTRLRASPEDAAWPVFYNQKATAAVIKTVEKLVAL